MLEKRTNRDWYQKNRSSEITKALIRNKTRRLRLQLEYVKFKSSLSCIKCKISHPAIIVFHHRDPETKIGNVSKLFFSSKKRFDEEIKKCDVLCHNCHRIIHYQQRNG